MSVETGFLTLAEKHPDFDRIVYQCPGVTVDIWERVKADGQLVTIALDFDTARHLVLNRAKPKEAVSE